MLLRLWTARWAHWGAFLFAFLGVVAVQAWVDLSPGVESEFFFAEDDPQLRTSQAIADRFGSDPQVVVRVEGLDLDRPEYERRIDALTGDLLEVEGIASVYSITTENAEDSPLFSRILLTGDSAATNIVLQTDGADPEVLLPRLEGVVQAHTDDEITIVMSGVPVIVELIRRALFRDLIVFSLAAVAIFALIISAVYRDPAIVAGTIATCMASVSVTLLLNRIAGVGIGLLTANLVTIVFVLTLSHVVFLTANWRRASEAGEPRRPTLQAALRDTVEGSFWSMATTLLGFLSLLVASAKPLRELGIAGAIGTVTAMVVAYLVFPAFLGGWARTRTPMPSPRSTRRPVRRWVVPGVAVAVIALGTGVFRVDTDPGLLTYFAPGSALRDGLEQIDRDGGSSTLDIVVRDTEGGRVDSRPVFEKMQALQAALEEDPAVGMVLSPAILLEHARTLPFARFLTLELLLDLASSPANGRVGLAYATAERDEGHYFIRMHETVDDVGRDEVMARLAALTRDAGLEPVLVGGLYDLQAQLGKLIAASLRIGIGGLLLLFLLVAFVVSRSPGVTGRMWLCLAGIPLVVLGVFGHLGIAVDIITSPAANVALAMGVDSMIHLVVRVRRLSAGGVLDPWALALSQIRTPVLAATGIICAGFGIFVLSQFPPTQRFGLAVMLGTLTAATMTLAVLPTLAAGRTSHDAVASPS